MHKQVLQFLIHEKKKSAAQKVREIYLIAIAITIWVPQSQSNTCNVISEKKNSSSVKKSNTK